MFCGGEIAFRLAREERLVSRQALHARQPGPDGGVRVQRDAAHGRHAGIGVKGHVGDAGVVLRGHPPLRALPLQLRLQHLQRGVRRPRMAGVRLALRIAAPVQREVQAQLRQLEEA